MNSAVGWAKRSVPNIFVTNMLGTAAPLPNLLIPGPDDTQAFLAHKVHHPSGLNSPSTRWHVFFAELKLMQLLHFCVPFGCSWYFTSAFGSFSGNPGASDSAPLEQAPNSVIGTIKQQPAISAPRSTVRRDRISSCTMQVFLGKVFLMFLLMAIF